MTVSKVGTGNIIQSVDINQLITNPLGASGGVQAQLALPASVTNQAFFAAQGSTPHSAGQGFYAQSSTITIQFHVELVIATGGGTNPSVTLGWYLQDLNPIGGGVALITSNPYTTAGVNVWESSVTASALTTNHWYKIYLTVSTNGFTTGSAYLQNIFFATNAGN